MAFAIDIIAGLAWLVVGFAVMVVIGAPLQSGMAQDDPARAAVGAWAAVAGLAVAGVGIFFTFRLVNRRVGSGAGTRRPTGPPWGPSPTRPGAALGAARGPVSGGMPVPRPNTLRQGVAQGGWTKPAGRPGGANRTRFVPATPARPSPFGVPAGAATRAARRPTPAAAMGVALLAGVLILAVATAGTGPILLIPVPLLVLSGILLATGRRGRPWVSSMLWAAGLAVAPLVIGVYLEPSPDESAVLAIVAMYAGAVIAIGGGYLLVRVLGNLRRS